MGVRQQQSQKWREEEEEGREGKPRVPWGPLTSTNLPNSDLGEEAALWQFWFT